MNGVNRFFSIFSRQRDQKPISAQEAKERLRGVLFSDRIALSPDQMAEMRNEIIAVISKYVNVDPDKVALNLEQRSLDNWLVADVPLLRIEDHPRFNTGEEADS